MRKKVILVTGAAGEVGQALITRLSETGINNILALDIHPIPDEIQSHCALSLVGDILDENLINRLISEFAIPKMFHLAALLSTRAEFTPEAAHHVNVDGTLRLLKIAAEQSEWIGEPVKFIFPSSVAVYGLPDLETKFSFGAVKEYEWNQPTTMYGCNKLYCEHLGRYYANHYRQLAAGQNSGAIDFRSVRFPGLISAFTLPTGGTSDYGPEMVHHAARGEHYNCFVREDSRIPFMAMPDAIKAVVGLASAPRENLTSHVYNVTSFNPSAEDIYEIVRKAFPSTEVTFNPDWKRQAIVDTWPSDVNDNIAQRDWGWKPDYDQERTFEEYLLPNISKRYAV